MTSPEKTGFSLMRSTAIDPLVMYVVSDVAEVCPLDATTSMRKVTEMFVAVTFYKEIIVS
jgi:hypothetical protein